MSDLKSLKTAILKRFHKQVDPIANKIEEGGETHQKKAKLINSAVNNEKDKIQSGLPTDIPVSNQQQARIVLQYCASVISLEYRHKVWPYEYMALSRRVGELWERFCSAAWDLPSKSGVKRIAAPSFSTVTDKLRSDIGKAVRKPEEQKYVLKKIDNIMGLIENINMKEDEVFMNDELPHVVDFKSGFGSNEKGNTTRLLTVGRAYKLWNKDTQLLFLIRQKENNHYLEVIRRSGLWKVYCGEEAYKKIDEITGSNITYVRNNIVDFKKDLSDKFWEELSSHLSDLTSYLKW